MRITWPIMASVSPSEWSPQQVAEWMRGLDDAILPYVQCFLSKEVNGRHLLMLAADDLPTFNVTKLGHQDLILEAIDLLRHFHYNLDSENLQSLSLKLSCKARSLYNELKILSPPQDGSQERVTTPVLSNVANILTSVKSLVSWLDRDPFVRNENYTVIRNLLLHLSIELATNAVRDRFAEEPIEVIKSCCLRIAEICEKIIQESRDFLIIQPAYVDVATVKKKPDEELGLFIHSSYSGIHNIGKVKLRSPACLCESINVGDEVLQVNYQNVVGWQLKKLVHIMKENPTEIILTLKKRPRHSITLNQNLARNLFYQKKAASSYVPRFEWQRELCVSSQVDLFSVPSSQPEDSPKELPEVEEEEEDDSAFLPEGTLTTDSGVRILVPRPRLPVQRRATVTGASPNNPRAPVSIDQLWLQVKREQVMRSISHDPGNVSPEFDSIDQQLRVKETDSPVRENHLTQEIPDTPKLSPRPNTCIGADPVTEAMVKIQHEVPNENLCHNKSVPLDKQQVYQTDKGDKDEELSTSKDDKDEEWTTPNETLNPPSPTPETPSILTEEGNTIDSVDETLVPTSLKDFNNALKGLRESLKSLTLTKDDIMKASSLPRTLSVTKSHPSASKAETSSNPNLSAATNSETSQSYQVFIAGGVAQVAPPKVKDDVSSPKESPVLRRKGRTWEFASRRVSCKDLGMGDCQGWLYKRKDHSRLLTSQKWTKRWCVLKNHSFYCYVDKDDLKAESLMYLPAFSVSPAVEIKSKKFAFKVYHSGSTFFFASDTQQDMSKWMNKMGLAAIAYDASETITTSGFVRPEPLLGVENVYYSETENDSEDGATTQMSDTISTMSQDRESIITTTSSNTLPKYSAKNSSDEERSRITSTVSEVNLIQPRNKEGTDTELDFNIWSNQAKTQRATSLTVKSHVTPRSPNISSLSLQSIKVSSMSSVDSIKGKESKPITKRVHVGKRGWVSFEKRINKTRSKLTSSAILAPAFEMNLDSSPPRKTRSNSTPKLEPRSPSILQKLGLSPRCEKKASSRNTKWFDKESEQGSSSTVSSEDALESNNHNKLKSSASQTDIQFNVNYCTNTLPHSHSKKQSSKRAATWDTRGSFPSSQNQQTWLMAPIGRDRKSYRTQMTVHIGKSSESSDENTETIRSPRKPAMGVAMIGKHRRSSTVSDKSLQDSPGTPNWVSTSTQATQTDNDDGWIQLFTTLHSAQLTIDGVHVGLRRTKTMLTPYPDKRISQQLLLLRSLQRTLKAKELDLQAIEELFSKEINKENLELWIKIHPHLCQDLYNPSSSDVVESE